MSACEADSEYVVPPTPTCVEQFTKEWLKYVMDDWFVKNDIKTEAVDIVHFSAALNSLQGLLSTTYIVDIDFTVNNSDQQSKSIFVKVPLTGHSAQNFKSVNVRENSMLGQVLPRMQNFIDANCTDILQLPIPEIIYSHYCGDEIHDAFILQNLVAEGFTPFKDGDLNEVNLKSCLECLAQLHGTGLAYKLHVGGIKQIMKEFPEMEEQAQIKDVLDKRDTRKCIRRNYLPFLKYMEISDPGLINYTTFLTKVAERLFHIFQVLNTSGLENILTLCHGDSKPDNFMFRKIEIDLEDMECEGLEGILIDWQGGFLGSVSNDLMWLLPPFLEANNKEKGNEGLLDFALEYYCTQMSYVLASFGKCAADFNLPEDSQEFGKMIKRSFILEFLNVIIINPIIQIPNPPELRNWYRKRMRHEERVLEGKSSKPPVMPVQDHIFSRQNFLKFANLYLKVGYILGGFQELSSINFSIMRETMFGDEPAKHDPYADEHEDDVFEDEEIDISDDEAEDNVKDEENKVSIFSRIVHWILSLFDINRYKLE